MNSPCRVSSIRMGEDDYLSLFLFLEQGVVLSSITVRVDTPLDGRI
jgi:hypothetical protein